MKKTRFRSKKILYAICGLLIAIIAAATTVSVFALNQVSEGWSGSAASVADPLYVKNYFDKLPRAYEVDVNIPEGTAHTNASPIISNYPNNDTRDCFGFEIHASGKPGMYFYETSYDASARTLNKIKTYVKFNYSVIGQGWVHLAVTNEITDGVPVYKLYVNGALTDTVTSETVVHDFDPVYSQSTTRELSIGTDGKNYFKGTFKNLAVYSEAITAEDAQASFTDGVDLSHSALMAYYTLSDSTKTFIKDSTGNGHDATPAFFARSEALEDYAYSFAFVGDTQFLMYRDASQNTTSFTGPIYDWILRNKDSKKIKYVLGMGDITDRNTDAEWECAVAYHNKLTDAGIPYAVIPGNHDDYTNYTKYNTYFGSTDGFTDNIDGYYVDGRVENYYTTFEVGEHKYMIVALQYGAPDGVLAWANEVVSANPDRKVIVITHSLFDYEGNFSEKDTREQTTTSAATYDVYNNGIDMWNEFISLHENIVIAASGHVDPEHIKRSSHVGVNGNTVHTFLIDPQGLDKATEFKTGMVAMFYFSEDGGDVQVEYISTTKTLAAQASNSNAADILFHENNQFSFRIGEADEEEIVPDYSGVGSVACYVYAMKPGDTSYTLLGSSTTFRKALGRARDALHDTNNGAYKGGKAWIYVTKSLDAIGDSGNYNFGDVFNGTLTVDFGGHTLTTTDKNYLLGFYTTNANASNFTTNVKLMNGTIVCRGASGSDKSVIRFHGQSAKYEGVRNVNIEFENITFSPDTNGSTPAIILATDGGSFYTQSQKVKANVIFNGCNFNFANSASLNILKDLVPNDSQGNDNVDIDVTVKGSSIIRVPTADENLFINSVGNKDEVTVSSNTTVILPYSESAPTQGYSTTEGVKHLASKTQKVTLTSVEYAFSGVYVYGYGYIPESDSYKVFSVFSENGYHIGSYDKYYEAMNRAKVVLAKTSDGIFTGKTVTIYMHRDFVHSENNYNNFAQIDGTLVIDLNGKTLTHSKNYLFDIWAKGMTNSEGTFFLPYTKSTVKNGTILMNSPIARISGTGTGNFLYEGTKNYDLTFDNVTFDKAPESTEYKSVIFVNSFNNNENKKFLQCNLSFTGCTFNTSSQAILDFTLSDNVLSDTSMSECTFKTNDMNSVTILAKSEGAVQTLILDEKTTLELPIDAPAPSFDASYYMNGEDGVEYVFVESSENGEIATYVLKEKALATFVPKTSITLSSTLAYNVYVPVSSYISSFALDGVEYTDISDLENVVTLDDGNSYYLFKIALPSASAARDIVLTVKLTSGAKEFNGSFTMSIPKYAKRVISLDSICAEEKAVVKDALAYIRSAYVYFGSENLDAAIADIDEILGEYNSEFSKVSGESATDSGIRAVQFILSESPVIRFYLSKNKTKEDYTFKYGDTVLKYKNYGNAMLDGEAYDYVDIAIFAYQLIGEISYSDGTSSGTYHINSYYEFITTDEEYKDNEALITLVEKLYTYCKSAAAYREYVLNTAE